jgi:hypothetical protein
MKRFFVILGICTFLITVYGCGFPGRFNRQTSTLSAGQAAATGSTEATAPITSPTSPAVSLPTYPFENMNMFFGTSLIKSPLLAPEVKELGMRWVSLQPHVIWFAIESAPGVYDWTDLDREVLWLQALHLDITMVLVPSNLFGSQRAEFLTEYNAFAQTSQFEDATSQYISFMRDSKNARAWHLYPHDDTLPIWLNFIRTAVDRYDGDGKNDMPGLKYQVRNWHLVEEFPMPDWDTADAYVSVLKATYPVIKSEDPYAKVIIPGLAGNYARYFAFADGYIQDPDGGEINGRLFSQASVAGNSLVKSEKEKYETILRDGKDFFDIIDIHLYEEKDTFLEGKLDYLIHTMQKFGYQKPIWCIEGGGPLLDPPGVTTKFGDPYFGNWDAATNAEYVLKFHVMAAAKGVQRYHWGLTATEENGYWNGPWTVMALLDHNGGKKPAYYTFKLMVEKLDNFTAVKDLSFNGVRLFEFTVRDSPVYVVWNDSPTASAYDLSAVLGTGSFTMTPIVIQMASETEPVIPAVQQVSGISIPVSRTPAFLEPLH